MAIQTSDRSSVTGNRAVGPVPKSSVLDRHDGRVSSRDTHPTMRRADSYLLRPESNKVGSRGGWNGLIGGNDCETWRVTLSPGGSLMLGLRSYCAIRNIPLSELGG